MNSLTGQLNLLVAWVWILLGFGSGLILGLGFHRADWLGGYASFRRRLYRLAHISLFGLGTINLLFHLTLTMLSSAGWMTRWASTGFVIGALTMPVCCVVLAHRPAW